MIKLSRLRQHDGEELVINAELIEMVERTPDTVITLTTGHKVIVSETPDEVIRLVIEYRRQCGVRPHSNQDQPT